MGQTNSGRLRTERETTAEALHLRNYDVEAHQVWINVVDDGEQVFETTTRLGAGGAESVAGDIPPGEYDVEVGVDGLRRSVGRCRLGDAPERTALVEMGNGVISVTEGVY